MNTARPARQVTLIGKACARRNFREAHAPVADQLDGATHAQMYDIAVRREADTFDEHAS